MFSKLAMYVALSSANNYTMLKSVTLHDIFFKLVLTAHIETVSSVVFRINEFK